MKKDKIKFYLFNIFLVVILILALFKPNILSNKELAFILLLIMFIMRKLFQKRNNISIYNKNVLVLMIGFSIIYVALFYISGLYFGFYESPVKFGLFGLINFIIPIIIIVIASETIRYIILSQNSKYSTFFATLIMVLLDIVLYSSVYDITVMEDFLVIVGFIIFSSISCNFLYNYVSNRYGYKSVIVYRLITSLYLYIFPLIPNIFILFRSVFRMIYPYIIYVVLEYSFNRRNLVNDYHNKKMRYINNTLLLVFTIVTVMFVSCKFKYGVIVIGSGSMTGTINKGDVVLFEARDKDNNNFVKENDVIIFNKDDKRIVHRVIDKKIVNGKYMYATKGDANLVRDKGYIDLDNIVGKVKIRIPYLGYLSIWFRNIFYE